ncbi:MAG: M90 family metallopeptidase [Burkholderiales bacterium]
MFTAWSRWRQRRILQTQAIPEGLWRDSLEALPFLAIYTDAEIHRLREKVVLFLNAKSIVGARGHRVTPRQRVVIALQACVLVLNLDLAYYDGWDNVIVYPDEFVPGWEWEDEAGVLHTNEEPMAGEAMERGPVILSWADVEASQDWNAAGMNLAIHEFAHKLDMRNGVANGCPPLPAEMPPHVWKRVMMQAYEHFQMRVNRGDRTAIDPYAAESPAEFFAVLTEVFFVEPLLLHHEYLGVYQQFARFYRQEPAARAQLLMDT